MKKKQLLMALCLCTIVSFGNSAIAKSHDVDVPEIIGKTYDGYVTSGNGGAISNAIGSVIKDSVFSNNQTTSNGNGGALALQVDLGKVTQILNTNFSNNSSDYTGGAISQFRNSGDLLIDGGSFSGNVAKYEGGAIFAGGNATINNVTFTGNKTLSTNWSDSTNHGAYTTQVDGGGAAIFVGSSANVNVSNSRFIDNVSNTVGGAIAVRNDSKNNGSNSLTISDSEFSGNCAGYHGGAIASFIDINVSNSKFENNKANNFGGAIYFDFKNPNSVGSSGSNLSNVTFNSNTAASRGGAIYNEKGSVNVVDGIFVGNEATKNDGGAIWSSKDFSVTGNSLFKGNTSIKGLGGAIYENIGSSVAKLEVGDGVQFIGNAASKQGGAIYATAGTKGKLDFSVGNNVLFQGNSAKDGGAISAMLYSDSEMKIGDNVVFQNNEATNTGGAVKVAGRGSYSIGQNFAFVSNSAVQGGAIYQNASTELKIGDNAVFKGNNASVSGGAIYNNGDGSIDIGQNSAFVSNSAVQGGAIFQKSNSELAIDKAYFADNVATGNDKLAIGGAIASVSAGDLTILNSIFDGNSSQVDGGAIGQIDGDSSTAKISLDNVLFNNNSAVSEGGAIVSDAELVVKNSTFTGNKTTGTKIGNPDPLNDDGGGGAIFLYDEGKATISSSAFENNSAGTYGGAISTRINASNDKSSLSITESNFVGNTAGVSGGAIASFVDATVTDANFVNNSAGESGGAIFANGNLTVNAKNSDIVMSGNSAVEGGDIYMNTANKNLNMNIAKDKTITVADGISGSGNYNFNVNADSTDTGSLIVNSYIKNATMNVQNGTLHLAQGSSLENSTLNMASGTTLNTIDGKTTDFGNNVTLADNVNLAVDLNLSDGKADNFAGANVQGKVTVTDINKIGNTTANNININLAELLGINQSDMTISSELQNQTQTILTPIRYLQGSVSENGMLTMAPTGSGYKDFNPAIMASPVAAQLGGYLTQLNSYDEAFRNMDLYMLMTKEQRQAMKLRNKYAASDGNLIFDPTSNHYERKAVWFRPYATFENVPLKGGPRVSNVAYGSFFGGDSEMYDLGHGWDGMLSVYAGYNGSHQAYDGIGIYQNGGTLGVTGMAYKGNFFTGLTINAGANAGEASTAYGTDNFSMIMAGVASKTGYNWELAKGKFIIQPSYMMSYSFVNTFDYTNAAGVRMESSPLNAIQIEPGIKFIGNLKNGWQPYLGVSMVWNIMDRTHFNANNVSLPELSVKPYVRYGIGVRKTWGDRLSGFIQAFFTGGGRNGVGFQAGFRYNIGKASSNHVGSNKTPELPKTQIKLSSMK